MDGRIRWRLGDGGNLVGQRQLARIRRYGGWIVLFVAALLYYRRYAGGVVGMTIYPQGAECLWQGQPLLKCAPMFSYPPALAFVMAPFAMLTMGWRLAIWYVLSILAMVACYALAEALARRLYPAVGDEPSLTWFRIVTVPLSLKFALETLNYQSYDIFAYLLILLGAWALAKQRGVAAGAVLAFVAAIKATPLIFLPYLILKHRIVATLVFLAVFVVVSFLPDAVNAVRGLPANYTISWVRQVAGPAVTPGATSSVDFWHGWMSGDILDNQSLRGTFNRLVKEPLLGIAPRYAVLAALAAVSAAIAGLLLASRRRDDLLPVDASILMIGMLLLSPVSSRYHFLILSLPYAVVVAACFADRRMRTLGIVAVSASFMLLTGTSNDLGGSKLAEFAYGHGFFVLGVLVLLVPLGAMIRLAPLQPLSRPDEEGALAVMGGR